MSTKKFSSKYVMGTEILGDGNFAVVRKCTDKQTGQECAVKCIKKSALNTKDVANIHRETAVLRQLDHPNIVKLYDVYNDDKDMCYLVMELVTGGELFDRIIAKEHYTELEAKEVIDAVANVLVYCHAQGIAHRDLKPENLLYDSQKEDAIIKVADFGFAKVASEGVVMSTMCGTPGYFAPEVIARKPYEQKCDIWSLGVILYILLSGFPPFYDDNQIMEMEKIRNADYDYPSPYFDNVSDEAKDLIDKMLVVDVDKRLSAEEILQHPWFNGFHHPSAEEIQEAPKLVNVGESLNEHRDLIKAKFKAGVSAILLLNRSKKLAEEKKIG